MGWYGVFGSVIFCLTGLFASISAKLSSFHFTRDLAQETKWPALAQMDDNQKILHLITIIHVAKA